MEGAESYSSATEEMKDYLQDWSKVGSTGPLEWWKTNQDRYLRYQIPDTSSESRRHLHHLSAS